MYKEQLKYLLKIFEEYLEMQKTEERNAFKEKNALLGVLRRLPAPIFIMTAFEVWTGQLHYQAADDPVMQPENNRWKIKWKEPY